MKDQEPEQPSRKTSSVDDLLASAELLGPSERKELLDRLSLARTREPKTGEARDSDMYSLAVYSALVRAIGVGSGAAQGPALVKRQVAAQANWAPVAEFMAASGLSEFGVAERQSIYYMLADLAVARAAEVAGYSGAPMSAKLAATCSAGMAALFERAFPGYLSAGLAPAVARRLVAGGGLQSI